MAILPKLSRQAKLQILILDLFVYLCAIIFVYVLRIGPFDTSYLSSAGLWLILFSVFVFNYIFSTYDIDQHRGRALILNSFLSIFSHIFVLTFIVYFFGIDRRELYGRGVLVGSAVIYFFVSCSYRILFRKIFKKNADRSNWIILCDSEIDQLIQRDQMHGQLRGQYKTIDVFLNSNPKSLFDEKNSGYIVAVSRSKIPTIWKDFLLDRKMSGEAVMSWADFVENSLGKIPVQHIETDWLVFNTGYSLLRHNWLIRVKRITDLILALVVAVLSAPFMLLTAIAVALDSRGPILYHQRRTGFKGSIFTIYKFRSMRTDAEVNGPQWAAQKDSRITRVGSFIRKTRLDELPQLYNVILGEMSFIGPRPERPEFNKELEKKIPFYNLRHSVRPGLTGWAQIMYPYGASDTDSKNKLEYELYYIKNYSLLFDALILLKTIKIVLFGRGR